MKAGGMKNLKKQQQYVLSIGEIWLVNIEDGREKLKIVGALAQRMWEVTSYKVNVVTTLNRREALMYADFVTTQFKNKIEELKRRVLNKFCCYRFNDEWTSICNKELIFKRCRV